MDLLAKAIARIIFWGMCAWKRPGPPLAHALVLTAALGWLFVPQATFITANGTTQGTWQVQPTGPQLENDGSGNLLVATGGGTNVVNVGSSAVTLQAGISLAGTAGAGGISCGTMTGNTVMPTGNFTYTAASGKGMSLTAQAGSTISTTTGPITLGNTGTGNTVLDNTGSGNVDVCDNCTTNVNIANTSNDPGIVIGDQSGGSQQIAIGGTGATENVSGTLNFTANATVTAAAGTGGVSLGSMTGATTLPTGNLNYTGATNKRFAIHSPANSIVNTTGGTLLDLEAEGGGTIQVGNNTTNSILECTGGLTSSTCLISMGSADTVVNPILSINTGNFTAPGTNGTFLNLGPTFQPKTGATYACGTGGTQTVAANEFGITVTTGTLTSNCVIDFGTNGTTGEFLVDMSGTTLGATFGVQFKNGTATSTFLAGSLTGTRPLAIVWTHGTNTLAVR